MEKFLETLKNIGLDFVQNTGLAIVRTIAFLVLGLVVIKIVQSLTRATTLKSRRLDKVASSFVVSIVTVVLYIILVIVLVSSLGFSTAGIIAAFSAVALAVALALKDSLASLANGVIIIFTKPFKKGDYVEVNGIDGLVQDIRLFNTKILTYDNVAVIIPNSEILSSKMINYSAMPIRRVVIDIPVSYDAETGVAKQVLLDKTKAHPYVVNTPAPSVVLKEYGSSALVFTVRAWTPNDQYWDTLFELREGLLQALNDADIKVPFNHLEVTLLNERDSVRAKPEEAEKDGADEKSDTDGGRL